VDEAKGKLGVVESILAASAQDIVSMNYQGKEILFPISDAIVLDANHERKELYVRLPNGLLEIYLQY
jgi:16S rRNA processing protein RimM